MLRPVFSPARVATILLLAILTAWYCGVIARNTVPTSTERVRVLEVSCARSSVRCVRP